ncbi:hypothetical protein [Thioalkalivibrio paradoxus]|uniref:Uncharacterized protein n=1 Tax=Thioalkalivibrio paradoxus ARh 1 TaxID=713585 RepID=W0DS87_9GAMM|nr:hypothetical protein [Thioalkalivibrio paradoxus]AHE99843.1 hypothetical protein THITH_01595 [Thioalkalivibrio paradoxus ARh 1]
MWAADIAARVQELREQNPDVTQREIAESAGVTQQRVSQVITCTPEKKQAESKRLSARQLYLPKDAAQAADIAAKVREMKEQNPEATQREIAAEVGISDRHVRRINEDTTVSASRKARNSANTTARQLYLPKDAAQAADIAAKVREAAENPLRESTGRPEGKNVVNNNIRAGNHDQTYTLRRLARDNPELLDKVEAGELTANAAAIQAGFRKPTKTIPVDSAESAVRALLRVFLAAEIQAAITEDKEPSAGAVAPDVS